MEKQEKEKAGADNKQRIEHVGKVLTDTVNAYVAFDTFENGNPSEITSATLDLSWTVTGLYGGPYRAAILALYSVIEAIVSANKPDEKSIVETLDDPDLWNDCTQLFLGKLSQRFYKPLPFKYEENLSKDSDVEDFLRALLLFCQAHTCYLTLLMEINGRFEDLSDRILEKRKGAAKYWRSNKDELAFLSDKKYITFWAPLPSSVGKSTKILIQKPESDRGEEDRRSLNLSPMSSNNVVQNTVMTLSKRHVSLNFEKYDCPLYGVQFIKSTNLPLKIVSSEAGSDKDSFFEALFSLLLK